MLDTLNPGKLHVTNSAFRVMIANPAATALITPLQRRDPNVLAALSFTQKAEQPPGRSTTPSVTLDSQRES